MPMCMQPYLLKWCPKVNAVKNMVKAMRRDKESPWSFDTPHDIRECVLIFYKICVLLRRYSLFFFSWGRCDPKRFACVYAHAHMIDLKRFCVCTWICA